MLLDWLAQDFEPGVRYPERTVNTIIARRHPDTAAWRRYLVDEEFLERRGGRVLARRRHVRLIRRSSWPHPTDDLYAVLGVSRDASVVEIRDAYRRLARQLHPDRARDAGDGMAAVNEAYRVLGDPGRRAVYDASRRTSPGARSNPAPSTSAPVPRSSLAPLPPARVPWRLMATMAGVGAVVVVVLAAFAATVGATGARQPDRGRQLRDRGVQHGCS